MYRTAIIFLAVVFVSVNSSAQVRFRPPKIKKQVTVAVDSTPSVPAGQIDGRSSSQFTVVDTAYEPIPVPDSIIIPSVDFSGQPIQDVLRLLSAPYGINMSVDPQLKTKITLQLTNIKLKDIILFIIRENGCDYKVVNNIIQVFEQKPLPPPAPLPPPKQVQVFEVNQDRLTLDLKEAELDSVVRWLALKAGLNIITENGIKTRISAFFKDMPMEKGLAVLWESNGLQVISRDGINYLMPAGGGIQGEPTEQRIKHFITIRDSLVSFNVNNASLSSLIKEVAKQADLDIYFYGDVAGTVTAKVTGMSIDDLFESLLRNSEYTCWKSKGIYFFGKREMYEKKVFDLISLNYMKMDQAMSLLPNNITSRATVKPVKEYNAILVEAQTSDIIESARQFIRQLDRPIAQILIEAWVVEINLSKIRNFGLSLYEGGSSYQRQNRKYFPQYAGEYDRKSILDFIGTFTEVGQAVKTIIPANFVASLDVLEQEGISNLISKPQIATQNGYSATITIGTTRYYMLEKETVVTSDNNAIPIKDQRLETINVDMTLTVTPWVSGNNEVTMDVSPNFDVPGASNDPKIPPPVNRRSLRSTVRVKDGEMIVLGGLISESESITLNKVPLLGDIPFLKWIFSSKKKEKGKTQMMIYLIPHVYYGSEQAVEPKNVEIKPGAMLTQNIKSPQEIKERELNKDIRTGKRQLRSEARHKRWKERIDRLKNRRKHRDMDKENHDKEGDAGKDTQPQTGTPVRSPKEENTSKTVSVKE